MKQLQKFIKKKDIFGHVVKINVDQNQKTHKTLLGGIITILISISLLDMITTKVMAMVLRTNNNIITYTSSYDVENGDGINFNQTSMFIYHVLKKQKHEDGPLFLNASLSQYLDVFFT